MLEVYTEINIRSTAETVWQILTTFEDYATWNPFIKKVEGKAQKGNQIEIHIFPPGLKSMRLNPTITELIFCRKLQWQGKFLFPGILDGEHSFIIKELADLSIRLIQKEYYSGLLIPFSKKQLKNNTKQGFNLMNQAIKAKAESL